MITFQMKDFEMKYFIDIDKGIVYFINRTNITNKTTKKHYICLKYRFETALLG